MIRAIIIDDEKRARNLFKNLLEQNFTSIKVVAEGDDIDTGIEAIEKYQPDLVFLDIKMHQGTGFDLLQQLKEIDFEVIFITAYDQYAIKAFQFSAFGYLMKPIRITELKKIITKLENHLRHLKSDTDKRLKVLIENYGDNQSIKKLVISNQQGFQVSKLEDILRLEGDGNYTNFILTNNKKIMTSKNLGEYEELLNDFGFYRIHQSTIVNLRHVKSYIKGDGGEVIMADGKQLQVSRHRKASFLKKFF